MSVEVGERQTLPLNTVVAADALDFLRSLPDESVDCFWSSPPYNLDDPLRSGSAGGKPRWMVAHRYAGGKATGKGDGLTKPEPEYQAEQAAILTEWHRVLKADGVAFYNHKVRVKGGVAISPLSWIFKTPFLLFQEVVWDRGQTANVDTRRFLPVSERIYVLVKRPDIRLDNPTRLHDVLRVPPSTLSRANAQHPCPTHPAIVRACLSVLPRREGQRPLVVDPYFGSGTTGLIAEELDCDWLGCDQAAEYIELSIKRIGDAREASTYGLIGLSA